MFSRTVLCALAAAMALALLSSVTEAHSWADCVDWRFKDPKKPGWADRHGTCHAWARRYPLKEKVKFGRLDSHNPNRHYDQGDSGKIYPCSDGRHGESPGDNETRGKPIESAYGGKYGTMATATPGQLMCVRWPAKNHARESGLKKVHINMQRKMTKEDPSQKELDRDFITKDLAYGNCTDHKKKKEDFAPCGGCFNIREDQKPGTYLVQWRWQLNDDEFYTSCWDVRVIAKDGKPAKDEKPKPKPKSKRYIQRLDSSYANL
ncbi:hypothetical protein BGX34_004798 [Mortierella sp. NVP85]|nr:hypothetical protein BGX34_004798 [Mortierella sp. NVP85]